MKACLLLVTRNRTVGVVSVHHGAFSPHTHSLTLSLKANPQELLLRVCKSRCTRLKYPFLFPLGHPSQTSAGPSHTAPVFLCFFRWLVLFCGDGQEQPSRARDENRDTPPPPESCVVNDASHGARNVESAQLGSASASGGRN